MGAIASTGLYNTDKTASNLDSGHTRYQMVPNVEFIRKKKKEFIRQYPFIALVVLWGKNKRWLAQHIKSSYKNKKIETQN